MIFDSSIKGIAICYEITRKGCEFISNKLTGQKGTIFTATYINRFHEMEQREKQPIPKLPADNKAKRLQIQEMNARARMANAYLKIANNYYSILAKLRMCIYNKLMKGRVFYVCNSI